MSDETPVLAANIGDTIQAIAKLHAVTAWKQARYSGLWSD